MTSSWFKRGLRHFGLGTAKKSESEALKITKVKVMDGAVNAEMFKNLDDEKTVKPQRMAVPATANGEELLKLVVDVRFMMSFKTVDEAVPVMTRCCFVPLGIAPDGADGNSDTLYVLIDERKASLASPPYMGYDVYRDVVAVLSKNVRRALSLKLVRVRSAVVNLVIDYVYYNFDLSGDDVRPCCLYAAAPYLD